MVHIARALIYLQYPTAPTVLQTLIHHSQLVQQTLSSTNSQAAAAPPSYKLITLPLSRDQAQSLQPAAIVLLLATQLVLCNLCSGELSAAAVAIYRE